VCFIGMKRAIKVILPALLLIVSIFGMTVNANAFTIVQTHIIDNDDAQGYSNSRMGFNTSISGSTLYYQDARTQRCVPSDYPNVYGRNRYWYFLKTPYKRSTYIYGTIYSYLYNAQFTDPCAEYLLYNPDAPSVILNSAGTINQDLAAAGWNKIGDASSKYLHTDGTISAGGVYLIPSSTYSTKYCGADAIKVELGYT